MSWNGKQVRQHARCNIKNYFQNVSNRCDVTMHRVIDLYSRQLKERGPTQSPGQVCCCLSESRSLLFSYYPTNLQFLAATRLA
jgi:hypothetical protein